MQYTYIQVTDGDGRFVMPGAQTDHLYAVVVYQGDIEGEGWFRRAEAAWERHNLDRPLGQAIRSMSVGDVIVFKAGPVLVADSVGFKQVRNHAAHVFRSLAERGVPGNRPIFEEAADYYASFEQHGEGDDEPEVAP